MFPDVFLPNALLALCGMAAAVYLLRSGMIGRGLLLMATVLVAADVALVARFVYEDRGIWYLSSLWVLELGAGGASLWLLLALCRRRWSADARRRDELFRAGHQHYLRAELGPARHLFRRILRADPWDVAALIALANVRWRQGRPARARDLLVRARRLDRTRAYADLLTERMQRFAAGRPATAPTNSGGPPQPESAERSGKKAPRRGRKRGADGTRREEPPPASPAAADRPSRSGAPKEARSAGRRGEPD